MNEHMIKLVTITRNGEKRTVALRQMDHDPKAEVGKKMQYGHGPMWTVLAIYDLDLEIKQNKGE